MASEKQRKSGYILPVQIDNHPLICVSLKIPDVPEYRAAFLGALITLSKWWSWERDDTTRGTEAAAYWRFLINEHLAFSDCTGGEVAIPEFRMIDAGANCQQQQYRIPPDEVWIDLGDPVCSGTDGIDGTDGICSDCTSPPNENTGQVPSPPAAVGASERRCQVAEAVSKYVIDNYRVALEEYTIGVVGNGEELLRFARRIQTELPIFYLVSYLPTFGAWVASITATSASNNFTASGLTAARQAIECHLYCSLPDTGDLTASILATWKTKIGNDTGLSFRADLVSFMNNISLAELRTEAFNAVTFDIAHDCSVCECSATWVWAWAATACVYNVPVGWSLVVSNAEGATGATCGTFGGFQGIYSFRGGNPSVVQITITPPVGVVVESIKLQAFRNTTAAVQNMTVAQGAYTDTRLLTTSYVDYLHATNETGPIVITMRQTGGSFNGVACRRIEIVYGI